MKRFFLPTLLIVILLTLPACSYADQIEAQMSTHPAKVLLGEDDPDTVSVKCRYSSNTEGTCYSSYSVYKELTQQQMEQIADYIELGYIAPDKNMQKNEDGRYEYPISIAFYKEDTDELIDAFMFKGGKRQEPSEDDIFIPGDRFDENLYQ
jgi:hypothetical protein